MVCSILPVAPLQGGLVEVVVVSEGPSCKEIVLHESDQPLDLSFGERMPRLAELRLETHGFHEHLIFEIPDWLAVAVPADDDALHVVGQNILGNTHVGECPQHPDEQILLLGIREELHVTLSTMMTDHRETRRSERLTGFLYVHCGETPVHLVGVARVCRISSAPVALRLDSLPFGRHEIKVGAKIIAHGRLSARVSHLAECIETDRRVPDSLPEATIKDRFVSREHRRTVASPTQPMRRVLEAVGLEPSELPPGDSGSSFKFCKVDLLHGVN